MPRRPSDGRVTEAYGPRTVRPTPTSPLFHYGEDSVGYGNRFPVDGVITSAAYVGSYGNRVVIEQANDRSIHWWLCHNASLPKGYGTWGKEGDFAAPMGATGNVTGVHVHTERRVGATTPGSGNHTNPASVYGTTSGGGTTPIPPTTTPVPEEDDMSSVLVRLENNPGAGSVYVWNLETNEIQHVPDGYQWGLVGKFLKNITFAEMNQFNFVRQQYANVLGNNVDSIVVPAPTIDLGTVGEQLAATLATYLSEHGVEIDYVKIGEVVDATLADNFNTVNKNIDEQEYVVVPKAAAQ